MNTKNQQLCVWSGLLALAVFGIALWPLAGFIPAWSPMETAAEVAARYRDNTFGIRLGMALMLLAAALMLPFVAVVSIQMTRIEGRFAALSLTQAIAGAGVVLFIVMPALLFSVAAFRPERSPETTQVLNDLAWIVFAMPVGNAMLQDFAVGVAILSDKNPSPVFPRWLGFFNLWVGLLFLPGGLIAFFKTGPFAWDGLLAFYAPAVMFGVWFIVMARALLKAIKQAPDSDPTPTRAQTQAGTRAA